MVGKPTITCPCQRDIYGINVSTHFSINKKVFIRQVRFNQLFEVIADRQPHSSIEQNKVTLLKWIAGKQSVIFLTETNFTINLCWYA